MKRWRVLLVDDHEVVRLGLKDLIAEQAEFEVVAEATTETEAVQKALAYRPDIVLMDLRLAEGSGIVACEQIMAQLPQTKVIILTAFAEDKLLSGAIGAGAAAYVLKQMSNEKLIQIFKAVANGEEGIDPISARNELVEVRERENAAFQDLTRQEMKVLTLVAQGKTNRQIAETLPLSRSTVSNYVSNILSKLGVANRAEAAAYAIRHRLLAYKDDTLD
jgi:DNA-binding NarL/FixJ family response regulator